MTLYNQSGIAILYSTPDASQQMLESDGRAQVTLPANGILSLQLSLPYGSMWQKPTSRFRWLKRIMDKSSLIEEEWSLALSSRYEIGGLSDSDTISISRRVSEFSPGYRYDSLIPEAQNGAIFSEHHEVPDRKVVLKRYRKKLWRYILMMSCVDGGILLILGSLFMLVRTLFDKEAVDVAVWGFFLLFFVGLTAWEIKSMGFWESPRLSQATKNKYITNFFHTHPKEYIHL